MSQLYVLFEHASGYALFRVAEAEEVGAFLSQIQKNISDVNKFKNVVELISFEPFKSGRDALENMNSVSEGILHPHLQLFLESCVPKSKKKHPVTLGVNDPKLAAAISESLAISCTISGNVPEIIRGIRLHFHKLVKGFKDLNAAIKAQLGLGHHYSRARVKFNVNRIDNMIIQSISLIDQLDKDINTFSMRVREWYSHHFPELIKLVPENQFYIPCVRVVRDRKNMPEGAEEELANILMDADKAHNIIEVARSSMGMEISPLDMENVTLFAERISSLMVRRRELIEYLKTKMHSVAPNLSALIGDTVGARLIAHAGSLINLAKFPASTVQILGAEKALFRALKTRGNTPKYGLIYHSTFIGRAGKINKGRISRYLANKCSVASRIDCFREIPTEVFGQKLRQQVEDRLKYFETGELPAKNVDVMTTALSEAETVQVSILKEMKKAKKREKKRMLQQMANSTLNSTMDDFSIITNETINDSVANTTTEEVDLNPSKKKKRKKEKMAEQEDQISPEMKAGDEMDEIDQVSLSKEMKKAKKREKKRMLQQMANSTLNSSTDEFGVIKGDSVNESLVNTTTEEIDTNFSNKKKKRKKEKNDEISMVKGDSMNESLANTTTEEIDTSFSNKKKKRKKEKMTSFNEN